jgi:hypothetical protein
MLRNEVIKLGEVQETVHITGCPSIDLADEIKKKPLLDFDPCEKYGGVGSYLNPKRWIYCSAKSPSDYRI